MDIKTKSNFLQKKRQQRKKTQEQVQVKHKLSLLHKNIRAFLDRKKLLTDAYAHNNVQIILLMGSDISSFSYEVISQKISKILKQPQVQKIKNLKNIILLCMKSSQTNIIQLALKLVAQNVSDLFNFFQNKEFIKNLNNLLNNHQGFQFLNYSFQAIKTSNFSNIIPNQLLFNIVVNQFSNQKIQGESIFNFNINIETILKILEYLYAKKYVRSESRINEFVSFGLIFAKCLQYSMEVVQQHNQAILYIVNFLRITLKKSFDQMIKFIIEKQKYKSLLSLISDQEQLQYFQHKITLQLEYQQFCQQTLSVIQKIFHFPKILQIIMIRSSQFRQSLTKLIDEIKFIYEDRRILFVYNFLADQKSLKQMSKLKKMEFYSALNMKFMTMDDQDFTQFNLFNRDQWRQIIQLAILKAYETTKKMVNMVQKKTIVNPKAYLFQRSDQLQSDFKVLSELLNNLNKKCIRTRKVPVQFFINEQLDKILNFFKFSAGSRGIQLMLKNFPFAFRFQSRMKKLKQFIKADKLNHDRSLFLQQQVDPDLIIDVRRGHQFLDAFQSCLNKDLRKKYKIIFFNQQGLEEQGIDGGGIIKEFINRVLKSSFSSVYGMFYETEQNQILPNPSSNYQLQYEFVGKIVGKAVYQSINIDQKFAQPFLNLLIGRQNTFQDLKFIDKQIYKSMVQIRRMNSQDLQVLQQSFIIQDENPFGEKKYVNLKNIGNNNLQKQPQVLVNTQNKVQFVESYADYKCNKLLQQKTRLFRKGFLTVVKSEWLTMFNNQQLNMIISGSNPNYSIIEMRNNVVYNGGYNQKSQTVIDLWSVLSEFSSQEKSSFLFYVTSCSRPPTLGFSAMKPLICIQKSAQTSYLPTANTCMNVLRLPDYKNKQTLKQKLLYAINAKAGFQFA